MSSTAIISIWVLKFKVRGFKSECDDKQFDMILKPDCSYTEVTRITSNNMARYFGTYDKKSHFRLCTEIIDFLKYSKKMGKRDAKSGINLSLTANFRCPKRWPNQVFWLPGQGITTAAPNSIRYFKNTIGIEFPSTGINNLHIFVCSISKFLV